MLLAKRGEDEISVGDRQEPELRLCSPGYATAPHATGADRDLGLDYLVPRPLCVKLRIEKTDQPRFLIILEREVPSRHGSDECQQRHQNCVAPLETDEKNPDAGDRQISERG